MSIEKTARGLLQKHALKHARAVTGKHDYLPETDEEAQMFEPHKWAVEAVVEALTTSQKERDYFESAFHEESGLNTHLSIENDNL